MIVERVVEDGKLRWSVIENSGLPWWFRWGYSRTRREAQRKMKRFLKWRDGRCE